MKKIKYLIYLLVTTLVFSSCATYNAPTNYQGRNLYKFTHKKRTYNAGGHRKLKFIALKKRGSYRHGAVPPMVRKELRQRHWSEVNGAGQMYK